MGNHTMDQKGWCMCSHHACFHDDAPDTQAQPQGTPVSLRDNMPGQENEKPRSNRAPLSPVQDFATLHMPNSLGAAAMDFATLNFDSFSSNNALGVDLLPQANPLAPALDTDSMPDTLSWKNVVSTQGGQNSLPPIPSQCFIQQSQSASTTASSQLRYLQPFGGKGLDTLSSVLPSKSREPTRSQTNSDTYIGSASHKEAHTCDDATIIPPGEAKSTPRPSQLLEPPHSSSLLPAGRNHETLHNLTDMVNDHEQRLDKLENGSVYNTAQEECSDKHDMADLRVTELEGRMDEVEKMLNDDNTSVAGSRLTTQRDDNDAAATTTTSAVPGPINTPAHAADHAALHNRLEALQARVSQLEASSLPSYTSPWELEVVFLPFPLKGIWQEAQEFKTPRLSAGRDEWTQMPNTNTRATPDPQLSAVYDEWAGQDSGWLLPRACVPGRMIDQRLRSRGLINTVSVRGWDARSVHLAVVNAFDNVLHLMPSPANPRSPYASDARVDKFFGLQQSWVPLRKVHKDSRLRFLSPAELLTPVSWNTSFLMDSVVMKATGVHRLYITQPEAYLQDSHLLSHRGVEPGWTWQRLRELPRVYLESQSSNGGSEVPEADALEGCWSYTARLDEGHGIRRVVENPHQPHEKVVTISRTSDGSTEQFFTGPSNPMSSMPSPIFIRGQSPLIQIERQGSRPPSIRTGSIPPVNSPIMPSPARSSRRVSSYALPSIAGPSYQRHSSPLVTGRPSPRLSIVSNPAAASMITKHRRRNTRSPSVRLHNTPRWSNRSFSRSPSVGPFFQNIYAEEAGRSERRMTPLNAYATPFSNAPVDYPPHRMQSHSRSVPVYENEDKDMDFDDDHGSSTDPDIDAYQDEDEGDVLDELESNSDDRHHHPTGEHQPLQDHQPSSSQPQGPEDEVWPGIEDNIMSDGENIDPFDIDVEDGDDADNRSDVSSQPSEYPSNQRAWCLTAAGEGREMTHGLEVEDVSAGGIGFKIHEDDDGEEEDPAQNEW